jgi:hypothetical protein
MTSAEVHTASRIAQALLTPALANTAASRRPVLKCQGLSLDRMIRIRQSSYAETVPLNIAQRSPFSLDSHSLECL